MTFALLLALLAAPDEILFPHARHVQAQVDCIVCHESIFSAKTLSGKFLPDEGKCLECHRQEKRQNQCGFCHSNVEQAAHWPKRQPRLKFDHAAHVERSKDDCTRCHSRLSEQRRAAALSDGHGACASCHNHADDLRDARCNLCHLDLLAYRLKPVSEISHEGDFLRRHALVAGAAGAACASCHDQNFCLDCHARTAMTTIEAQMPDRPDRAFIHRNDFIGRHPVEARADPVSCQRCHSASSCETCHQLSHVAGGSPGARSPHPSGWSVPGSGAFHGDAARRDIQSCASCHDQGDASNCVRCHKVGGIGGDPHPASFRARHSISEARSDGRCLGCHR
ncbi:MAG TPA: cytochrome c3 family protein [Myxococcales bacterium]|nr:cytochrome c3 family protein [Myxococcales bacterium]